MVGQNLRSCINYSESYRGDDNFIYFLDLIVCIFKWIARFFVPCINVDIFFCTTKQNNIGER